MHGVEEVKTLGDCAVAGLTSTPSADHAESICFMGCGCIRS